MSKSLRILTWMCMLSFSFGFRVTNKRWDISPSDPTLWIKVCPGSVTTINENDIGGGDVLAGVAGLTFRQVLQSVVDDYNNVSTSYVRLAIYPTDPNNPGTPVAGDSTFTIEKAGKRTIEICFEEMDVSKGLSGGFATLESEGKHYISCKIEVRPSHLEKAAFLTHIIAHEVGHCLSLMHPQEASNSVMSYFGNKKLRLQYDDYAGLTFAYPENEDYAKEVSTFGLMGCSPRN